MVCVRRWGQFTPRRLFLGVDARDPLKRQALEPPSLLETTPARSGRAGQLCEAFIRHRALRGIPQAAEATGLIAHTEVVDRGAFLLATVILWRVLWSLRAVDGAFAPIMKKRAVVGPASIRLAASRVAHASAVRAGSHSWGARAWFNTGWRR
jgi:hypothetical protein